MRDASHSWGRVYHAQESFREQLLDEVIFSNYEGNTEHYALGAQELGTLHTSQPKSAEQTWFTWKKVESPPREQNFYIRQNTFNCLVTSSNSQVQFSSWLVYREFIAKEAHSRHRLWIHAVLSFRRDKKQQTRSHPSNSIHTLCFILLFSHI